MRAIATPVPKLDPIATFKRVSSRPILPQGIQHNLADRFACLPCQRSRELRSFGVADMNLIPQGCFLCAERQTRYKCALATASPQLAAAVNAEIRDLKAAGADGAPARRALAAGPRRGGAAAGTASDDKALDGILGPTALHLCFGCAYVSCDRPNR